MNRLENLLCLFAKILVMIIGVVIYFNCFRGIPIFALIMIILFLFFFSQTASRLVNFFVYLNTSPSLLDTDEDVLKNGIAGNHIIGNIKRISSKDISMLKEKFKGIEKEAEDNKNIKNLKYIIIDSSLSEEVIDRAKELTEDLQKKFGKDQIFYFHRLMPAVRIV